MLFIEEIVVIISCLVVWILFKYRIIIMFVGSSNEKIYIKF